MGTEKATGRAGVEEKVLFDEPGFADRTSLERWSAGAHPGAETIDQWLADLGRRHNEGRFFFCVNRFLFNAWKDPN